MDIEKRIRMAVEQLLENEALRSGLDDDGATALLAWGTACAKRITRETAHIQDNEEANEASYPRMRALRQMLDTAKTLSTATPGMPEGITLLADLLENAARVYGPEVPLPERIYWNVFRASRAETAGPTITALQAMVEQNIQIKE